MLVVLVVEVAAAFYSHSDLMSPWGKYNKKKKCSRLLQIPRVTVTKVFHPSRRHLFFTPTTPCAQNPLRKVGKYFVTEQAWRLMRQNIQFDKCTVKSFSLPGNSKYWRSFPHYYSALKLWPWCIAVCICCHTSREMQRGGEEKKNQFSHRAFQLDNTFPLIGVWFQANCIQQK